MATQAEITRSYDPIDAIHLAALGPHADVSCAFYEGDESRSLEDAQARKHAFVLTRLGMGQDGSLLDIGCGWGPLLLAARDRGVRAAGLTLSRAQHERCTAAGFDVRLLDWKQADPAELGEFTGIASLGAFEHFVSPDEMLAGRQDAIYADFFRRCASMLPDDGKLYLQTMTWGARVPHPRELDVHAPRLSDAWVMGHLSYLYPGSWLPNGLEHIERCAEPWFRLTYASNGRNDYLATFAAWQAKLAALGVRRWWVLAPLLMRSVTDRDLRRLVTALHHGCARICFERDIFSHFRMVFERR